MIIIAIEGLDKSGKFTQTEMLREALARKGYVVEKSEFHRYDTPTGELIMKWLKKEWDVDQKTIELVMTADKQAQQQWFEELENQGVDVLILDRYTTSQLVYSKANGIETEWTKELQKHLRQPDLEILIDIPAEVSMTRKGKHNGGKNDRYESDKAMLDKVRELYLQQINARMEANQSGLMVSGEIPVEDIHKFIAGFVLSRIK